MDTTESTFHDTSHAGLTVQIVSDIHPEYTSNQTPDILQFVDPTADVLILAGDCGNLHKPSQLENLLITACAAFKYVLYVPGNHEYYRVHSNTGIPMSILETRLENIVNSINSRLVDPVTEQPVQQRLWVLQKSAVRIENVLFGGCTLWSEPTFEGELPNYIVRITTDKDSDRTSLITKQEYIEMHRDHVQYIRELKEYYNSDPTTTQLVVITHHPPCRDMFDPSELTDEYASLYYTDLPRDILEGVDYWVSGHIHKTFSIQTPEGCCLVSNQLGKPKRNNRDYRRSFTISLDA